MSLLTEIMYNTFDVIRKECKKCKNCEECEFQFSICKGVSPCAWSNDSIEKAVNTIDKKYHK